MMLIAASPVMAEKFDASKAGHPVHIVAYALYPVGVLIEYAILRPAYWLGGIEPFKTMFGRED